MSTLIKLKKSSVVGRVPGTGDLDYGELALNFADGKLYFKNSSNAIKAFGDSAQTETLFDAKFDTKTTSDLTEGSNLYYTTSRFDDRLATKTTSDLSEGTNLYYTTARADSDAKQAISVTDAGGDGSLTYSAATGVITYTGPSASEVRAHFSEGQGINIVSGKIAIDSGADVVLNSLTTVNGLTVGGNLQVDGTVTTVSTQNIELTDNMIYMNAGESSGSPTLIIDVGWAANVNDNGSYAHVGMFRDATDDTFKVYHNYVPEPDASLEINTGHASFSLAPFAALTLSGQYLGFDSDFSDGGTFTSDVTFNDNVKAIFGAGSDLQIYHDGSHSYVTDQGTGDLRLNGTNVSLNNAANNKTYLYATDGGSVQLRYNDLAKLATASTGVDVTGTAKADTVQLATTGILEDAVVSTSSTSQTAIVSYSATTYGGGKVLIEAKSGVNRHITEILVTHDGTTAIATEYGTITTSGNLATYDVDISGGNLRVLATPASATSTTFKVIHQTMFA